MEFTVALTLEKVFYYIIVSLFPQKFSVLYYRRKNKAHKLKEPSKNQQNKYREKIPFPLKLRWEPYLVKALYSLRSSGLRGSRAVNDRGNSKHICKMFINIIRFEAYKNCCDYLIWYLYIRGADLLISAVTPVSG